MNIADINLLKPSSDSWHLPASQKIAPSLANALANTCLIFTSYASKFANKNPLICLRGPLWRAQVRADPTSLRSFFLILNLQSLGFQMMCVSSQDLILLNWSNFHYFIEVFSDWNFFHIEILKNASFFALKNAFKKIAARSTFSTRYQWISQISTF